MGYYFPGYVLGNPGSGDEREAHSRMSSRVRRMLTLPLACACALSAAATGEVAGQVVPKLPSVPPIKVPSLPQAPPLRPPTQLDVPAVPAAPAVPPPSVPDTPVTSPGQQAASPSSGAAPTGTRSAGAASAERSSASTRRAAAHETSRRTAARHRRTASPRERRFRRAVKSLWACSYAVGSFERSVLVRRAGLDGFAPAAAAAVAGGLRVSVERVRAAQRSGLRRLRRANRADGCAMSAPAGDLGGSAKTLLAVATAPPLASDAGDAVAKAPESAPAGDRVEVLGEQRASTGVKATTAPQATLTLASTGDGAPAPWLLIILALLALAASTPLLLRRRRESEPQAEMPAQIPPEPTPPPVAESPPHRSRRRHRSQSFPPTGADAAIGRRVSPRTVGGTAFGARRRAFGARRRRRRTAAPGGRSRRRPRGHRHGIPGSDAADARAPQALARPQAVQQDLEVLSRRGSARAVWVNDALAARPLWTYDAGWL